MLSKLGWYSFLPTGPDAKIAGVHKNALPIAFEATKLHAAVASLCNDLLSEAIRTNFLRLQFLLAPRHYFFFFVVFVFGTLFSLPKKTANQTVCSFVEVE